MIKQIIALIGLTLSLSANATIISVNMSGEITSLNAHASNDQFSIGDEVNWRFKFLEQETGNITGIEHYLDGLQPISGNVGSYIFAMEAARVSLANNLVRSPDLTIDGVIVNGGSFTSPGGPVQDILTRTDFEMGTTDLSLLNDLNLTRDVFDKLSVTEADYVPLTLNFWFGNNPGNRIVASVLSITVSQVPIPAPATLALFTIGLAGLGWSRRKQLS